MYHYVVDKYLTPRGEQLRDEGRHPSCAILGYIVFQATQGRDSSEHFKYLVESEKDLKNKAHIRE